MDEVGDSGLLGGSDQCVAMATFRIRACRVGYLHRKNTVDTLHGRGYGGGIFHVAGGSCGARRDQGLRDRRIRIPGEEAHLIACSEQFACGGATLGASGAGDKYQRTIG
ncbi:hypothetical protein D3C81_1679170 [compost metagenome]